MAKEKVEPIPDNLRADIQKYPAAMAALYEKKLVGMSNLTETEVLNEQRSSIGRLLDFARSKLT